MSRSSRELSSRELFERTARVRFAEAFMKQPVGIQEQVLARMEKAAGTWSPLCMSADQCAMAFGWLKEIVDRVRVERFRNEVTLNFSNSSEAVRVGFIRWLQATKYDLHTASEEACRSMQRQLVCLQNAEASAAAAILGDANLSADANRSVRREIAAANRSVRREIAARGGQHPPARCKVEPPPVVAPVVYKRRLKP